MFTWLFSVCFRMSSMPRLAYWMFKSHNAWLWWKQLPWKCLEQRGDESLAHAFTDRPTTVRKHIPFTSLPSSWGRRGAHTGAQITAAAPEVQLAGTDTAACQCSGAQRAVGTLGSAGDLAEVYDLHRNLSGFLWFSEVWSSLWLLRGVLNDVSFWGHGTEGKLQCL